jgi:hypothetical protein
VQLEPRIRAVLVRARDQLDAAVAAMDARLQPLMDDSTLALLSKRDVDASWAGVAAWRARRLAIVDALMEVICAVCCQLIAGSCCS